MGSLHVIIWCILGKRTIQSWRNSRKSFGGGSTWSLGGSNTSWTVPFFFFFLVHMNLGGSCLKHRFLSFWLRFQMAWRINCAKQISDAEDLSIICMELRSKTIGVRNQGNFSLNSLYLGPIPNLSRSPMCNLHGAVSNQS